MARNRIPEVGEVLLNGVQVHGDNSGKGGDQLLRAIEDAIKAALQERGHLYYVVKCDRDELDGIECAILDDISSKSRQETPDLHDVAVKYHFAGSFGTYVVTATVAD